MAIDTAQRFALAKPIALQMVRVPFERDFIDLCLAKIRSGVGWSSSFDSRERIIRSVHSNSQPNADPEDARYNYFVMSSSEFWRGTITH
jgi:hypothetical protein